MIVMLNLLNEIFAEYPIPMRYHENRASITRGIGLLTTADSFLVIMHIGNYQ